MRKKVEYTAGGGAMVLIMGAFTWVSTTDEVTGLARGILMIVLVGIGILAINLAQRREPPEGMPKPQPRKEP
jgi:UDP-N-acetylmuramyl pentapeptide phosphotransferase/UDP-N-acetylglucosamine-1-phosphate transferase